MASNNQLDLDHLFAHITSAGAIVGTIRGELPEVAAVVALAWYLIQLWESKTVQNWRLTRGTISVWDHLTNAKAATEQAGVANTLAEHEIDAAAATLTHQENPHDPPK